MSDLNLLLFAAINAPANPSTAAVATAKFFADGLVWAVPLGLAAAWLWGGPHLKRAALAAAISGLLALLVAQLIGLVYFHPRPFAAGIGHTLIPHAPDSSFPSDHGTLMAAVGVSLLLDRESRRLGSALLLFWMPMAWARVYLGVHFPADLLGGLVIGAAAAESVRLFGRSIIQLAYSVLVPIYAWAFARCILRGWVRP